VKEYNIVDNLGYFMMDNATNNDRSLEELNKRIQENRGFGFDPIERRLRCFGHIMNLAVKDLLYGPKKKKKQGRKNDDDDEMDTRTGPEEEDDVPGGEDRDTEMTKRELEMRLWRALDAVGKAHNIVKYVRGKPQHRMAWANQRWKELRDKMLQSDNNTR
jgi:hypothetical protein